MDTFENQPNPRESATHMINSGDPLYTQVDTDIQPNIDDFLGVCLTPESLTQIFNLIKGVRDTFTNNPRKIDSLAKNCIPELKKQTDNNFALFEWLITYISTNSSTISKKIDFAHISTQRIHTSPHESSHQLLSYLLCVPPETTIVSSQPINFNNTSSTVSKNIQLKLRYSFIMFRVIEEYGQYPIIQSIIKSGDPTQLTYLIVASSVIDIFISTPTLSKYFPHPQSHPLYSLGNGSALQQIQEVIHTQFSSDSSYEISGLQEFDPNLQSYWTNSISRAYPHLGTLDNLTLTRAISAITITVLAHEKAISKPKSEREKLVRYTLLINAQHKDITQQKHTVLGILASISPSLLQSFAHIPQLPPASNTKALPKATPQDPQKPKVLNRVTTALGEIRDRVTTSPNTTSINPTVVPQDKHTGFTRLSVDAKNKQKRQRHQPTNRDQTDIADAQYTSGNSFEKIKKNCIRIGIYLAILSVFSLTVVNFKTITQPFVTQPFDLNDTFLKLRDGLTTNDLAFTPKIVNDNPRAIKIKMKLGELEDAIINMEGVSESEKKQIKKESDINVFTRFYKASLKNPDDNSFSNSVLNSIRGKIPPQANEVLILINQHKNIKTYDLGGDTQISLDHGEIMVVFNRKEGIKDIGPIFSVSDIQNFK